MAKKPQRTIRTTCSPIRGFASIGFFALKGSRISQATAITRVCRNRSGYRIPGGTDALHHVSHGVPNPQLQPQSVWTCNCHEHGANAIAVTAR